MDLVASPIFGRAGWRIACHRLGHHVVVENRAGAGGNLGTVAAVLSSPDRYTLLIVHVGTMTINPHIYANAGYDPLTDLAPITRLGVGPQALSVPKDVPARSLEELLILARARPGELTYVSPGVGTPGHLAASLLMHRTGSKAIRVPYKGYGQAVQDLIAGHVTFTIEGLPCSGTWSKTAGCARSRSPHHSAPSRYPTCRQWLRRACRATSHRVGRPRRTGRHAAGGHRSLVQ